MDYWLEEENKNFIFKFGFAGGPYNNTHEESDEDLIMDSEFDLEFLQED